MKAKWYKPLLVIFISVVAQFITTPKPVFVLFGINWVLAVITIIGICLLFCRKGNHAD